MKKRPSLHWGLSPFAANQKEVKMLQRCPSHLILPGEEFFHAYKISIWQGVLLIKTTEKNKVLEINLSKMNWPMPCLLKHHLNSSRWLEWACYEHEWLCSDAVIPSIPRERRELFAPAPNGSKYSTSEIALSPSPSTIKQSVVLSSCFQRIC